MDNRKEQPMDKVAIKRVVFHNMPDYILSLDQWINGGRWKGFLQLTGISINQIDHVESGFMDWEEFNSLNSWEG